MEIRLSYGDTGLTLHVPDGAHVDQYGPASVANSISRDDFMRRCETSGVLRSLESGTPLIVVNDGYRNTPTAQILGWLQSCDSTLLDRARFLIATGAHETPTATHIGKIFGEYRNRITDRLSWHYSRDLSSMVQIGTDRFGIDVHINKQLLDAETVLIIGSVEPHYFAGFTGGRKSIFPGLCDQATIERNHHLADSLDAAPLRLIGNPVAEQLDELLRLVDLGRVHTIQTVQDIDGQVAEAFAGRLDVAFFDAVTVARELYARQIDDQYDIIIAEVKPPLDRNLYQAQKALENTQMAVRDGGAVIVVSQCPEGVGSPHFYELATQWDRDANCARDGKAHFGSHKLSRVNLMTRRIDVCLHSALPPHIPRQVFYEPLDDVESFLSERLHRPESRLAIVHDAAHTVLLS
jgi:nickel-dependent lactate racemase